MTEEKEKTTTHLKDKGDVLERGVSSEKPEVIHIEISRELINPKYYEVRIGDIRGSINCHNQTKKGIMETIRMELDNI